MSEGKVGTIQVYSTNNNLEEVGGILLKNIKDRDFVKTEDSLVNHPKHYISQKGIEVIDVVEAFTDGLNGIEATDTGNIIKYACRWKRKNGIQDLEKIIWYTSHLINHLKNKENKNESK